MAIIRKKIWKEYFDLVQSGRKTFELRLADFDVHENDTLILQEWDKDKREYTGREIQRKVGYVGKFHWTDLGQLNALEEWDRHGMQIISLK